MSLPISSVSEIAYNAIPALLIIKLINLSLVISLIIKELSQIISISGKSVGFGYLSGIFLLYYNMQIITATQN